MSKSFKEKILLITYGVVLFVLLLNYKWIVNIFNFVVKILSPFIIGLIIAFVLNVLLKSLENGALKKLKKTRRIISISLSLIIIISFIVILLFILIPQLKNAGTIFVENIPEYQKNIYNLGEKIGISTDKLEFLVLENNKIKDEITNFISNNRGKLINISMGFASSIASVVCNFFVGIIFAIYILLDKEKLTEQTKKVLKKICSLKVYNKIIEVSELSNKIFSNFVKVQVLESIILGILCFIGMLIFKLPYAATISVLVGVTALIPIFGAFIGCIIGTFLIFMVSPIKALTFIIFFLILQQIEGNFIYPKVVGGKIGLPSIWVLVAVTIGGSFGGVFGMLLGVPVVSIVYSLLRIFINSKPVKKE